MYTPVVLAPAPSERDPGEFQRRSEFMHVTKTRRAARFGLLAGAAAIALVAAGCAPSAPGGSTEPGDDGLTKLTVGLMPVSDLAPIYLGIEQGFFEDEGLELDIQIAQGGAAIVPAVVSGEYQVGFSNSASLLIAGEKKLPIKIIANASSSSNVRNEDSVDVAVGPDSSIASAKDLEGKTVAVNALNNFGEIGVRNSVELAGGDPNSINFVEVPYPNMPAQLAAGEIDAAWTSEPFRTQILTEGGKIVASPMVDLAENMDIAYFFTSDDTLAKSKDVIDGFIAATAKSLAYASEHEDEARGILVSEIGLDQEVADSMVLTKWTSVINRDGLQAMGDAAVKAGIMGEVPDLGSLIYSAK